MNAKETILAVVVIALVGVVTYKYATYRRQIVFTNYGMAEVKQHALGFAMYAQDNDGRYPRAEVWMDATLPYTRAREVYVYDGNSDKRPGIYGYAFYAPLSEVVWESIIDPENVPLTFASTDTSWNAHGGLELLNRDLKGGRAYVSFVSSRAQAVDANWPTSPIVIKLRDKTD